MKNIIFDFDGTIVDSRDFIIQLYNEIAERDKYEKIDRPRIEYLSTLTIPDRCKKLNVPLYKIPPMLVEVRKKYKKELHKLIIKDGVKELLYSLKDKGFKLGIISSNSRSAIVEFFKGKNIDIFDYVYSTKNLFGKHYTINGYLKQFKIDKNDTIYIGDEVRDIVSCKKAGVKVIAVTWGYDSPKLLTEGEPEYLVDSPKQVLEILETSK